MDSWVVVMDLCALVMLSHKGVMWAQLIAGFSFSRNLWGFCVFFNAKTTIRLYGGSAIWLRLVFQDLQQVWDWCLPSQFSYWQLSCLVFSNTLGALGFLHHNLYRFQ